MNRRQNILVFIIQSSDGFFMCDAFTKKQGQSIKHLQCLLGTEVCLQCSQHDESIHEAGITSAAMNGYNK